MDDLNYSSSDVLAYIIRKCVQENVLFSITKGQKLLYCCYGMVLAVTGARLCDEHPVCWTFGPAFPQSYKDWKDGILNYDTPVIAAIDRDEKLSDIMLSTIRHFGKYSANALVNWSHKPNSPWAICSGNGRYLDRAISDVLIADAFRPYLGDENEDQ